MKKIVLISILAGFIATSCVSTKQFDEKSALAEKYLAEKNDCKDNLTSTQEELELSKKNIANIKSENSFLKEKNNEYKIQLDKYISISSQETSLRKKLNEDLDNYMQNSSKKQEELTQQLAEKERELTKKEASLNITQANLVQREKDLQKLKKSLEDKEIILADKGNKIKELQSKINEQNITFIELKENIKKALKDFTSEDLTVTEKDGKIYVSLSENLLFKSGSFTLDKTGKEALIKLSEVLAKQKDVDIVVEGHADSDPFKGKGELIDNWDLSVKRATSVVRILANNNVPKNKIVASGRADNKPVATNETKEGKAKNRRTEIILSPNLNKILKVLQE